MSDELTLGETAEALALTPRAVRDLIASGRLPGARRLRSRFRRWAIPAGAVERLRRHLEETRQR